MLGHLTERMGTSAEGPCLGHRAHKYDARSRVGGSIDNSLWPYQAGGASTPAHRDPIVMVSLAL